MNHPSQADLSLYASADLGWARSLLLGRHLRRCTLCRREVSAFRQTKVTLQEAGAEFPPELHWAKLASEMKANIRLGLEAGAIAGPLPVAPRQSGTEAIWLSGYRSAAAMATLTVLMCSAWLLNRPAPQPVSLAARGHEPNGQEIVLRATSTGILMEENGRSLALMHRDAETVTLTVGMQGSLRARYLDEDTGEVTIHHVYSE
ncbi:MAG: hypothetical protein JJE04_20670 [Acidobacteriia bacterium]|nr:hypothetical protein [Terriglobia bacterium]